MPHDIGSSRASGAVDTIALTSTESPENTALQQGKTHNGRSVSAFNTQEPFLLNIRGPATPLKPLSAFTITTAEPRTTFNSPQEQALAVAIPEAAPTRGGHRQPKVGSDFLQGAVDRLTNKGYDKTEASNLLQSWLDKPGASKRSVKKLVINAPYKDLFKQEAFDRVTSDLKGMGYTTKSARKLAEGIVLNMSQQGRSDNSLAIMPSPSQQANESSDIKSEATHLPPEETFVKKKLYPSLVRRLKKNGYSKQEAIDIAKWTINSLGGPAKCNVDEARRIVRGFTKEPMSREKALYTLQLDFSASPKEIRSTYLRKVLEHHPDKHVSAEPAIQEEQAALFMKVHDAFVKLTK